MLRLAFFLLGPFDRILVAWVDDEPALLVSYCLTHPFLTGWGAADDSRTQTSNRVARYQTDY